MSALFRILRKFRKRQDGTVSVEFVILFPIFIFVLLTGFESGFYMVRNVMLDRAVDIAMRDVRLGNTMNTPGQPPDIAALKRRICNEASIFPNCMQMVQVELRPVPIAPGGIAAVTGNTRCVDTSAPNLPPSTVYDTGEGNSMMVVRVCALADPLFPSTRLATGMAADPQGNLALITINAFVNEPGQRTGQN